MVSEGFIGAWEELPVDGWLYIREARQIFKNCWGLTVHAQKVKVILLSSSPSLLWYLCSSSQKLEFKLVLFMLCLSYEYVKTFVLISVVVVIILSSVRSPSHIGLSKERNLWLIWLKSLGIWVLRKVRISLFFSWFCCPFCWFNTQVGSLHVGPPGLCPINLASA